VYIIKLTVDYGRCRRQDRNFLKDGAIKPYFWYIIVF